MNRFTNIILIKLIFLLGSVSALAQDYPVQVNTQLIPPYSLHLSDYVSPGTNRISSTILLNDFSISNYQVYLKLFIEGDNVQITTSETYRPPVYIQGGIPHFITSSDLAKYFDLNNLQFSGISKQQYIKSGRLPEGVYRFSIQVYDYNKNIRVSNSSAITAWLLLNDPPIINLPETNKKIKATFPQNIFFQWMPRHMGSPNSAFTTEYEFTLVEIWPKGANPNIAMMTGIPIYKGTTTNTSLYYGVAEPMLEPGRDYAYRVQARDVDGRDMFKNEGYSEIRMFTFGDECKLVENVTAETEGSFAIHISWKATFGQSMFNVQYRKTNDDKAEWFEEETYMEEITIDNLEPGIEYEYRIMGYCGTVHGDYTQEYTVSTKPYNPPDFDCGAEAPEITVENMNPLLNLSEGDNITCGDFRISVREVTGSNGSFSGTGLAHVPYLGFISVPVEFEGIRINEEKQVYEGAIVSKYDENSPFVLDPGDFFGDNNDDETGGSVDDAIDTHPGDSIVLTGPIDTVIVVDDVIVVVSNGDSTYYEENDVVIVDDSPNGEVYVVDNGVVTPGEKPNSGNRDNTNETNEQEEEVKVFVTFKEFPEQSFGFDSYDKNIQGSPFGTPEQIQGREYYLPFKSVGQGGLDHVYAQMEFEDTTYKPEDVKFKNSNGFTLSSEPVDKNTRKISLIGEVHETLSDVIAYVEYTDTSGTKRERTVGKLKQISYQKETYQMKLVPVNMNPDLVDAGQFAELISNIYKQANVEWQVSVENRFDISVADWDKDGDKQVDDSESSLFSLYTKEMNKIIGKFKKAANPDDNTYYLLLLGDINPSSGTLAGYMPFKQQYGLIFMPIAGTNATSLSRIIAHEIGHGAFRLYHTFSSENPYKETRGQTNNLMDYNNGTHIHKYQWDYIHNPQKMIAWAQDEEEAAYFNATFADAWIQNINNIACTKFNNKNNLILNYANSGLKGRFDFGDIKSIEIKIPALIGTFKEIDLSSQKEQEKSGKYEISYNFVSSDKKVYITIPLDDKNNFLNIINQPKEEYFKGLANSIPNVESKKAYSQLSRLSECGYRKISIKNRIKYIEWLTGEVNMNNDQEDILIKLIKYTDNKPELYETLYEKPLTIGKMISKCNKNNKQILLEEILRLCNESWTDKTPKGVVYTGKTTINIGGDEHEAYYLTEASHISGTNNWGIKNYSGIFPTGIFDIGQVQMYPPFVEFKCNALDPVCVYIDEIPYILPTIYPAQLSKEIGNKEMFNQVIGSITNIALMYGGAKLVSVLAPEVKMILSYLRITPKSFATLFLADVGIQITTNYIIDQNWANAIGQVDLFDAAFSGIVGNITSIPLKGSQLLYLSKYGKQFSLCRQIATNTTKVVTIEFTKVAFNFEIADKKFKTLCDNNENYYEVMSKLILALAANYTAEEIHGFLKGWDNKLVESIESEFDRIAKPILLEINEIVQTENFKQIIGVGTKVITDFITHLKSEQVNIEFKINEIETIDKSIIEIEETKKDNTRVILPINK